jgi:NTE family protein
LAPENQFISSFRFVTSEASVWPESYACTAVDSENGALKVWRKHDVAPLASAVASGCAVPGIFPPISIHGRKWMDGGMRSTTNIDCAVGHQLVLVLAVLGTGPMAAFTQACIERETRLIERAGGRVELIEPDVVALATFGSNPKNASNSSEIVLAAIAQGRSEAARLRTFWK